MKVWGEALIEELISWFLASVKYLGVWQPLTRPVIKLVEIPLGTIMRGPDCKPSRKRLSRGPTSPTHRSDL
jgi:hypothetical protein